jgi:hypothetical protein
LEPCQGGVPSPVGEVLDIGTNQVIDDAGQDRGKAAVGYERNLPDAAVMVAYETEMGEQGTEVLPAGRVCRIESWAEERIILPMAVGWGAGRPIAHLARHNDA